MRAKHGALSPVTLLPIRTHAVILPDPTLFDMHPPAPSCWQHPQIPPGRAQHQLHQAKPGNQLLGSPPSPSPSQGAGTRAGTLQSSLPLRCPSAALGRQEVSKTWSTSPHTSRLPVPLSPPQALAGDKLTASPLQCGAIQPLPVRPGAIPLQPHVEDPHVGCACQESLAQKRTRMSSLRGRPAPARQLVMGTVKNEHSITSSLPGGLAGLWVGGPEPGS